MSSNSFIMFFSLLILFIIQEANTTTTTNVVNTLPGYSGALPFKLETGYIGVGENEEIQLYYYFVESQRDPDTDPLLLLLTGGPGCSSFSSFFYEIGPLTFDLSTPFDWRRAFLVENPYSWGKIANIIFLDSPVGAGFSYSNTSRGYDSSDTKAAKDNDTFLRKWLLKHPRFIKNQLFITGESYAAKIVTMVTYQIDQGNEQGLRPRMNLQGYMIGNPITDINKDINERIPYAHRMALISDQYFELAKSSCNGEYATPDPNNYKCLYALELYKECTKSVFDSHILDPTCYSISPKHGEIDALGLGLGPGPVYVEDFPPDFLLMPKKEELWCRNQNYRRLYIWANSDTVQQTLRVRKVHENTLVPIIKEWKRCNKTFFGYEKDVESVVIYHRLLNEKGYQALVYSGDHDLVVPYMSTLKWIHSLNFTIDDQWRPWFVDGQVAGYAEVHVHNNVYLTFATVKGAGHTAPEYKPKECFAMINRWLSQLPL